MNGTTSLCVRACFTTTQEEAQSVLERPPAKAGQPVATMRAALASRRGEIEKN